MYEKDIYQVPFQFYKIVINESGVVAGSFLVNQIKNQKKQECPWFWWSPEKGLHLSKLITQCQILNKINDHGFILFEHYGNSNSNTTIIIKNIFQPEYSQVYNLQQYEEFSSSFEKNLKDLFCKVKYLASNNASKITINFNWYPFVVDQFDNDFKIVSHGTCTAVFVRGVYIEVWSIRIGSKLSKTEYAGHQVLYFTFQSNISKAKDFHDYLIINGANAALKQASNKPSIVVDLTKSTFK